MLDKISADDILKYFSYFSQKKGFEFHANCLFNFLQSNIYSLTQGEISADDILKYFLTFPENSLWHFIQIVSLGLGDNLHEMPKPIFWEI